MYHFDNGWAICVWIITAINLIWMTVVGHDAYFYWQQRYSTFMKPRMPKVTLMYVASVYLIAIHRTIDALIGLEYIDDSHEISRIISFVEIFPSTAMLVYKLWITFYLYRYNEKIADQGWTVLLLLGTNEDSNIIINSSNNNYQQQQQKQHLKQLNSWNSHWTIKVFYTQYRNNL